MLVLTLNKQQIIHIGDDIEIILTSSWRSGNPRIGISAPIEIPIFREKIQSSKIKESYLRIPNTIAK